MIFRTNKVACVVVDATSTTDDGVADKKQLDIVNNDRNGSSPKSGSKKKRSVAWSSSAPQVKYFSQPADDEPSEAHSDLPSYSPWYSQADYDVFYQECLLTTMLVKKFGRIPSQARDKVTTRGLGHMISEERAEARRLRRIDGWEVVLGEQQYQRQFMKENRIHRNDIESMHHNAECIASLYKQVVSVCQTEAHLQALQDAKQAKQVLSK